MKIRLILDLDLAEPIPEAVLAWAIESLLKKSLLAVRIPVTELTVTLPRKRK